MDVYVVEKLPIIGMGKINYKQIAENYMESHPI